MLHASIYHPNCTHRSYTPPAQFLINTTMPHHLTSQHLRPLLLSYQIIPPPSHCILRTSQHLRLSITQFLPHHSGISANIPTYLCISSAPWHNVSGEVHPYKSRHIIDDDVPVSTGIIDLLFRYVKPLGPPISKLPLALDAYKIGAMTKQYTVWLQAWLSLATANIISVAMIIV